ncbi:magnesium transporter [Chitinophaga ginsengisegetis]|uniref:Magnesium transporter MgtE n=1 Tax=Chitinophaga ginsengisegetis TaxID=393003 RepID=A0A1T5NI10_9BACT|nr:magnesium transporter [Chitinophaga ginsengisegetis]MDR6569662.1 magnesium transporter [Chitinophaga ginsengisegetis]MDR6649395.1 magnesium transporter [Chitinophaga ginsengisegetis]MDR6655745.1 magnesium transporter [Chitinophaga ginsengisegetis]SKD00074.1 magnesium transporter [Chitinophaga ginsengisegetis]
MENEALLEKFQTLTKERNYRELSVYLDDQLITDIAELIHEDPEDAGIIINHLSIGRAAAAFRILDFPLQEDVIRTLSPAKIAELMNELPADDRTAFLEELPSEAVKELIKLLDPEERRITLSLLGYKENSVGRIMTPDYIAVREEWTVKEVLDYIREHGKDSETIDVIYVIDEKGQLLDDFRIREFLLVSPETVVHTLMDDRFVSLHANDNQEEAIQVFRMENRVALPVVDDQGVLLGIVTIDDMLWIANEEHTEDIQKIGGTEALDEPYLDMPLLKLVKKRVGWLVVLFIGEMLTATAMGFFEDEIAKAVVLALFVPLIISSGGNSGSQASTLIIQAMALGEISVGDWWRVMRREILSGLLLGGALGAIGFLRILLWNTLFNTYGAHTVLIGATVGISLVGVVLWGTLSGSMLPLVLKKCGADPATSSAPFVATLVDVTGLLIYFTVAYTLMKGILL